MARATETEVRKVIDTSLTSTQVNALLADANLWVTEELTAEGYSTDRLKAIEKYLTAHFCTMQDPRLKSLKEGDVTETYQRDAVLTDYLRTAIGWDPSGTVEKAFASAGSEGSSGAQVRFRFGDGYSDPDAINYSDLD